MVCYDAGIDGFRRDSFDAPEFSGEGVDPVRRRIDHDADDVYVPFSVGQAHAAHDVRPEVVQERVDLLGGVEILREDRQYRYTRSRNSPRGSPVPLHVFPLRFRSVCCG